jgi:translation elongation factor EF-1beta
MTQNKKQSIKTSIKLLDDAYRIIMDLIQGNDEEDFLDDIQEILSGIDDVQYKIETISLDKFEKEIEEIERIQKDNN